MSSTIRAFIPAFIVILIAIVPWLIIFPKQLQVGLSAATASPAWAQVVGAPGLKSFLITFVKFTIGRISYDNNLIYVLLFTPVGIFIVFLFLLSLFRISKLRSFLWFWFFGPIFLAFALSFFVPIFAYFRFIFVLGAFYLIWASAINTINWIPLVRSLLIIALTINLTSVTIYYLNPKFQRENWRAAISFVHANSTSKTIILFDSEYTVGPFDYYNKDKVKAAGALDGQGQEKSIQKIKQLTTGQDKIFLFQYLSPITDPGGLVLQELTKQGFTNTKIENFDGVGFIYEFKKK